MTMEEIRGKEAKLQAEVSSINFLVVGIIWKAHDNTKRNICYQVSAMEEKLKKLQSGVVLVKPEDKKAIEETYSEKVNQWRKRKRIFKELWDAITENSPKDLKEFKVIITILTFSSMFDLPSKMKIYLQEELGIEYDEDVGVNLQAFAELINPSKKRRTAP